MCNWIIVDDGQTFEGTFEQFKDCFFDNAEVDVIKDWAKVNNMKVEFVDNPEEKILT